MRNILFSLSLMLFGFLLFFLVVSYLAPARKTIKLKTKDFAVQLYEKSRLTQPSLTTKSQLSRIIEERLGCYSDSPLERINNCDRRYLESIVNVGREKIHTPPNLGLFIPAVKYCPIVYNICMGYKNNSAECIVEETQCIDNTYDEFWRGKPIVQTSR